MADRKITELSAMSAGGQATGDLLTIVDVSEAAAADKNKKITMENLFKGIPGNVGIGTTSPSDNLTVAGSSGAVNLGITANTANAYDSPSLKFLGGNLSTSSILFGDASDADIGKIIYNHDGNSLAFTVNASERLRISSSGDVGIGTSSPTQKLHVQAGYLLLNSSQSNGSGDARLLINQGSRQYTLYPYSADSNSTVDLRLSTPGASNQVTITDAGNMGLGTASPAGTFDVSGNARIGAGSGGNFENAGTRLLVANTGGDAYIQIQAADSTGTSGIKFGRNSVANRAGIDWSASTDALVFRTGGTSERMRITASGNMGLGTASPSTKLHVAGIVRIGANDDSSANLEIGAGATGNRYSFIDLIGDTTYTDFGVRLIRNNGGANTTSVLVHRGTGALQINSQDAGNIQFLTDNTERARLTSSGDFGLGISSPTKKLHVNGQAFITGNTFFLSTDSSAILAGTAIGKYIQTDGNLISGKTTTNGNTHQAFCNPNGIVGTIRSSGSATQYNTSSDYRLKENVVDIVDGITRVKQLQPRRFNFIADADTIVDGFIAHEAQTVVPEAVSGTHNEVDDDGNAVMQGIDTSKLVPLLTAALQEEIAKREALEARIAALEG